MSEALIVSIEHAASLTASNVSNGKYWAKCPAGKVQRIKAIGWFIYGSGGLSSDAPVDTTFKLEAKVDQRPITNLPFGTAYQHAASSTNYNRGISTPLEALVPVNDVMVQGEQLNIEITSPTNGEGHVYALFELVDLAELQLAAGVR